MRLLLPAGRRHRGASFAALHALLVMRPQSCENRFCRDGPVPVILHGIIDRGDVLAESVFERFLLVLEGVEAGADHVAHRCLTLRGDRCCPTLGCQVEGTFFGGGHGRSPCGTGLSVAWLRRELQSVAGCLVARPSLRGRVSAADRRAYSTAKHSYPEPPLEGGGAKRADGVPAHAVALRISVISTLPNIDEFQNSDAECESQVTKKPRNQCAPKRKNWPKKNARHTWPTGISGLTHINKCHEEYDKTKSSLKHHYKQYSGSHRLALAGCDDSTPVLAGKTSQHERKNAATGQHRCNECHIRFLVQAS